MLTSHNAFNTYYEVEKTHETTINNILENITLMKKLKVFKNKEY